MAQAGYTPISLYYSTTAAAVPTTGNLANGELGLNIADMKLYAKNSAGTVTLLASNAGASGSVTSVSGTGTVNGLTLTGTVTTSGSLTLGGTLSGTASININGTVGATTPTTGAFTTVAVSSNISADNVFLAGNLTLPLTGKLNFNGNTATDYMVGPSNGVIDSYIASTRILRLTSTGLGIRKSASPDYPLDVELSGTGIVGRFKSTTNNANLVVDTGNTAGGSSLVLKQNNVQLAIVGTDGTIQGTGATDLALLSDIAGGKIKFYTNGSGTVKFEIGAAGQFGIGGATYGTAGQVLTSGGSGAAPTWAAAGGGSQAFVAFGSTGGF